MKRCLSSLKIRGGQIQMECYFSLISVVVAVQSLNHVWLFLTLWPAACQARLSSNVSQSLLKFMSIKSVVMISNHLILCYPLLLLPSIFLSIKVFSKESVLCIRWPKYWSFSFSISPSNEYSGLISLQSKGLSRVFSSTTIQKHQFFGAQPSLWSNVWEALAGGSRQGKKKLRCMWPVDQLDQWLSFN